MKRLLRIIEGGKPGKRLRGHEEFETPEFVGRMDRVERGRRWVFWVLFVLALGIGGVIGLLLI